MTNWPIEEIPSEDYLYMRVHYALVDASGNPLPAAFRNHGDGMSSDWSRYSTPRETLERASRPAKRGVVQMIVGKIRDLPDQRVEHTPEPDNRAHTDVFGEKTTEVRVKFLRISSWAIPLQ